MTTLKYPFKPEYCAEVIQLASEGRSMVQIAAGWKITEDTIRNWAKDLNKPEFMEAYRVARTCNEGYWEDVGQKGAKGVNPKFNYAAWSRIMGVRHKKNWAEVNQSKIELKNEFKTMSSKEIDEAIKLLLAQRALQKTTDKTDDSGSSS